MMEKKIIIPFLLMAFIGILNIQSVFASGAGIGSVSTGSGGTGGNGSGGDPHQPYSNSSFYPSDYYQYSCKYGIAIYYNNEIYINAYDRNGKSLNGEGLLTGDVTETGSLDINTPITSGTYIGLNVFEKSYVGWDIVGQHSGGAFVQRKRYKCTKKYFYRSKNEETGTWSYWTSTSTSYVKYQSDCATGTTWYNGNQPYKKKVTREEIKQYDTPADAVSKCKKLAYEKTQAKINGLRKASYTVEYRNPNDINSSSTTSVSNSCGSACCNAITVNSLKASGLPFCTFDYNIKKTCINTKTGDVYYITKSGSKCDSSSGYVEVAKNGTKANYFIPLNTKTSDNKATTTDDGFTILVNTTQSKAIYNYTSCQNVINRYRNWENLIVAEDGVTKYDPSSKGKCKIKISSEIKTQQKFYNVASNSIKGFNVYYQPININNPFPSYNPNDNKTNSLWKKYNYDYNNNTIETKLPTSSGNPSSTKSTIKLSKSFDKKTYTTGNLNLSILDRIKKDINYKYADWSTMSSSGKSSFIGDSKYVTREDNQNTYKIGAGPCVSISKNVATVAAGGGICP